MADEPLTICLLYAYGNVCGEYKCCSRHPKYSTKLRSGPPPLQALACKQEGWGTAQHSVHDHVPRWHSRSALAIVLLSLSCD
jgi:hypothetical protein